MIGRVAARTVALALVAAGGLAALASLASVAWIDGGLAERTTAQQVGVGEAPTITIHVGGGELLVETGVPGRLSVTSLAHVRALTRHAASAGLAHLTPRIGGSGGAATLDVATWQPSPWEGVGQHDSRATVTVPPGARLVLDATGGSVDVRGVAGDIDLAAGSGTVELRGITVRGQVRVRSRGSILFTGSMAGGALDLATRSGDVEAWLPVETDARLTARTEAGRVTIADQFGVHPEPAGPGGVASGNLGRGGPATVTLASGIGSIRLLAS